MRLGRERGLRAACAAGLLALVAASGVATAQPAAAPKPYAWSVVPFGAGGFVDGFLYHPKAKNLLYARTDIGGMYRFDFKAKRWIALLDHLGRDDGELMGVLSMAVDPNDPRKLYAATGEYLSQWGHLGAVLRSDDQGATWSKTDLTIRLGGNADGRGTGERLQVDPNVGAIVYLGSNQDGLWKSVDGAKTFAKVAAPATSVTLVLFDPASGAAGAPSKTIYLGAADGKGGLYVSHDAGASFDLAPGAPRLTPQHAVFAPDGTLYVAFAGGDGKWALNPGNASDGGVWKLDPKSGKWSNISPERPGGGQNFGYSGVDVDPAHPGVVVASTLDRWGSGDDIYRSTDGGAHWKALGPQSHHDSSHYPWLANYMGGQDRMGHWISDVKINPFNPDELIYGTGYGLWMTENLTAADSAKPILFDFAVTDFEETATTQIVSPVSGATLFVAFGDVAGAAWDDITKTPKAGLFLPMTETDSSVDYAGLKPDVVVRNSNSGQAKGYISPDGGASWASFAAPFKSQDEKGWHGSGSIAISAGATSMIWAPEKAQALVSTDLGKSWQPVKGWPADRDNGLTPVSDKAVDKVFYVYDKSTSTILASIDGGASFSTAVMGLPQIAGWQYAQLAVVPGRVRDLWLAGPFGLLHSAGPGKPMTNLKGVDEAWLVGFGKAAPNQSYPAVFLWGKVKGKEGFWRSDDQAATWVRINDDRHQFGSLRGLSGDPEEFGTVYIAPHGRGVLVGKIAAP
jgi:hypothetical protein